MSSLRELDAYEVSETLDIPFLEAAFAKEILRYYYILSSIYPDKFNNIKFFQGYVESLRDFNDSLESSVKDDTRKRN